MIESFFCQEDNETNGDYSITLTSSKPWLFSSVRNTEKETSNGINRRQKEGRIERKKQRNKLKERKEGVREERRKKRREGGKNGEREGEKKRK